MYQACSFVGTDHSTYTYTTTTTTITTTFPELFIHRTIRCPLPEDVLQKITYLGLGNSKEVLKAKIKEAFDHWCATQEIDILILPVLLMAVVASFDMDNL